MTGFRRFLLRGNLIDLGLAVVIGVAFNDLVQALIRDLITPLIAATAGKHNFSDLSFSFHNSLFNYGSFINSMVSFLVIVAVVYYLVVAPTNRLATLAQKREESTERLCPDCLSDIPLAARRCRFCTAAVTPVIGPPAAPSGPADEPSPAPLKQRLTWRPRSWSRPRS
jgi:large conductance mechanosensitive channel